MDSPLLLGACAAVGLMLPSLSSSQQNLAVLSTGLVVAGSAWLLLKRTEVSPGSKFTVPNMRVIVAKTPDQVEAAVLQLHGEMRDRDFPVLGFDAEWRPARAKGLNHPVALIQLSTATTCVLVQMIPLRNEVPKALKELLFDAAILKVGVGVVGDKRKLRADYSVVVQGCVDLQGPAKELGIIQGGCGLKKLLLKVVGKTIPKVRAVQMSDWDSETLSEEQQEYAALDAFAGFFIFQALHTRYSGKSSPRDWCFKFVDQKVSSLGVNTMSPQKQTTIPNTKNDSAAFKTPARTKGPLYDNCLMLAKDGTPLCTTSRRKIDWYLERGLADLVQEANPLTIQLKFVPNGPGHAGDEFYMSKKFNRCVSCGAEENIMRHHVVPRMYRKWFPESIKSHSSHDIVLLCQPCHYKCSFQDERFKRELCREFGLDPSTINIAKFSIDAEKRKVKRAASVILKGRGKLPVERLQELVAIIGEYYGKESVSEKEIQEASEIDERIPKEITIDHGEELVGRIRDLNDFIRRWREHFLSTLDPQYLPQAWDVEHIDHLPGQGESAQAERTC